MTATAKNSKSGIEILSNGSVVNWDAGQRRPSPRKNRPNATEVFYPVVCGECADVRYVRSYDVPKAHRCMTCHLRSVRLANPSWAEEAVWQMLRGWNIKPRREVPVTDPKTGKTYCIDFVCEAIDLAIEVDGWGHCLAETAARDARVEELWNGALIRITTDQLREDREDVQFLIEFTIHASITAKKQQKARA